MRITENTDVPLGLVFSISGALVGAVMWLTTIYAQGNTSSDKIKSLEVQQASNAVVLQELRVRLIRIEDKLDQR